MTVQPTSPATRAAGRDALSSLLACAVLALSTASCAISSERDDERAVEWTRAYVDARCRYHVRCEGQFGELADREQVVCHPDSWATVLLERASRVGTAFAFDADRAARCLAAIEGAACRVAEDELPHPDLFGCNDVVHGAIPAGDACDPTEYGACADHGTCVSTEGTCGGVCWARAQRGESCLFRRCDDGLMCAFDAADEAPRCFDWNLAPGAECEETERCRAVDEHPHACIEGRCTALPIVALGEACADGTTVCAVGTACVEGTCTLRLGEGMPCRSRAECQDGLVCDAPAPAGRCSIATSECGVCPPESPYCVRDEEGERRCSASATGAPCRGIWYAVGPFFAPDSCPDTHRCNSIPGPPGVVCLPLVPVAAACDAEHLCADGARCVEGRCVALVGPGEACGASAACPLTHACVEGACAPLPVLGDACDGACFEGGCVEGRCELLDTGAACDPSTHGFVPQCEGACSPTGACEGTRSESGSACGGSAGACAHGLLCRPLPDDSGVCGAPCSE